MNDSHVQWLERYMELLRIRESCALQKKVQKEHMRKIYEQLPLKVMGPGGVEHAWKSLRMMQEGLDTLSVVQVAVDVDWQKVWTEQNQKVLEGCDVLKDKEKDLLKFEQCVVELRDAERQCSEHWSDLPEPLRSLVSQEDSIDVLEQVRLDCLMELEGDEAEENPEKNPYYPS